VPSLPPQHLDEDRDREEHGDGEHDAGGDLEDGSQTLTPPYAYMVEVRDDVPEWLTEMSPAFQFQRMYPLAFNAAQPMQPPLHQGPYAPVITYHPDCS
jgi:hypothetical protein